MGGGSGGAGVGRAGVGGGAAGMPPVAMSGGAGSVAPPVGGSTAGAGGGAGGMGGSMGVAGMYADEFPACPPMMMATGGGGSGGSGGAAGGGSSAAGKGGSSGGGAGGASGGAAGMMGSSGPAATFSDVYLLIKCNGCVLCHGAAAGLIVSGSKSELYEALVGADPAGKPTGTATEGGMCAGQRRVVPGNADQSVLYAKVAGKQMCGTPMPPPGAGMMWTPAQVEQIRSWIMAGAKKN